MTRLTEPYPNETNGLNGNQAYHAVDRSLTVDWTEPGLRITRLRLLTDPGFPLWDVSYCHGKLADGTPVTVSLPFSQLRKPFAADLIRELNRANLNGKRLGIWDAVSKLW